MPVAARLRGLFDSDAHPAAIAAHLGRDPLLAPLVAERPGLRVPGAFDGSSPRSAPSSASRSPSRRRDGRRRARRRARRRRRDAVPRRASAVPPTACSHGSACVREPRDAVRPGARARRDGEGLQRRPTRARRPGVAWSARAPAPLHPWRRAVDRAVHPVCAARPGPTRSPTATSASPEPSESTRARHAHASPRRGDLGGRTRRCTYGPASRERTNEWTREQRAHGEPTAFVCVPSPIGPICLTASPADGPGLTGLFTDAQKDGPARTELWSEDPTPFKGAIRELGEYFAGTRRTFDVPLRSTGGAPPSSATCGARSVRFPTGRRSRTARSARRVGRPSAVRAVGAAISKNPWGLSCRVTASWQPAGS